jgi:1A family penicillin-binding protein
LAGNKTQYVKRVLQVPLDTIKDKWRAFRRLSKKQQIAVVSGVTIIILILIPSLSYLYFVRDISDAQRLMNRNNTGVVLTDRNDEIFYSFGRSADGRNAEFDEIPEDVIQALIASEDKNFYEHGGFSVRSIAGALYANVLNRDVTRYGGSTITQQLVKNNLLTNRKNFLRKYQELAMSIAIERHYTKDQILEIYLNSVYFGEGAFGIIQAAETYFNKTPADLSLAESTTLIGMLPAPSVYSPISGDPEQTKEQQNRVLTQMVENDIITETEKEQTQAQSLTYAEVEPDIQEHAQHFTKMVMDELLEEYGEEQIARSGFRVETSLDLGWQKEAERILADQIARISGQGATNGSLVAIDPRSGEIRALVGSVDWNNETFGQVNMATSPRQPGSSFKPIYYTEAFDQELITPATIIRDERKEYGDYVPENFDFRFRGDISARYALATSLNIPAIEVMQMLGVEEASQTAQRMGISTVTDPDSYGLTLALGTAETEVLQMTNAYAAFANQGDQFKPETISRIKNKFDKVTFENNQRPTRVQSAAASYIISSILSDDKARSATFGSSLNVSGRDVAVKTGTTNDNKDAWTVGYTPSLSIGVWVGDNTNQPMSIGGSTAAGPIWKDSLQYMLGDSANEEFNQPRGIVKVQICNMHGTYIESFMRGTAPERCEPVVDDSDVEDRARREEEERQRAEDEAEEQRRQEEEAQQEPEEPIEEEPVTLEVPAEDDETTGPEDPGDPQEDEDPEQPIVPVEPTTLTP